MSTVAFANLTVKLIIHSNFINIKHNNQPGWQNEQTSAKVSKMYARLPRKGVPDFQLQKCAVTRFSSSVFHICPFLWQLFSSQAQKLCLGIFLYIIHLISVEIWIQFTIIDYSRRRTQKRKLVADFPRHQWQISRVMVGKKEAETEVFLETLARLLIDPAIGHFKLGCFNQPKNSSRRAYSFIFFSQKENFFAWYNYNKVYCKITVIILLFLSQFKGYNPSVPFTRPSG